MTRHLVLAMLLGAFGCGGDDSSGAPPPQQVTDQLGRVCSIVNLLDVTCDQAANPSSGCTAGSAPCFVVGTTGDAGGPGAICATCCGGGSSSVALADCSNISCQTPADCPPSYGRCVTGNICRY